MSEISADFAIFGTSPLALLLAGLLARQHRKAVVLVDNEASVYRLPRSIDISVGAITRPQTWALLADTVPETRKLLARIAGKTGISRVDPILFADSAPGRQALAHIRHMAAGFGHTAERLPPNALGRDLEGFALRDAVQLQAGLIEPALRRWLDRGKVRQLTARETGAAIRVLVDDEAILKHVAADRLAPILQPVSRTGILTEPAPPLAAPAMLQIDAGLCLSQLPSRAIVATGSGNLEAVAPQVDMLLSSHQRPRWAGQSEFTTLRSRDHAPVLGQLDENGPILVAGFAPFGAFLAPAIARWLVGAARPAELAYFAAHAPGRPSIVTEYGPGIAA